MSTVIAPCLRPCDETRGSLKIALFGQAPFAAAVLDALLKRPEDFQVVLVMGVAVADGARPDALMVAAEKLRASDGSDRSSPHDPPEVHAVRHWRQRKAIHRPLWVVEDDARLREQSEFVACPGSTTLYLERAKALGVELNIMAFVTQLIPQVVCDLPRLGSFVYHPSLLPLHRGANAIHWQIRDQDELAGFSLFRPDPYYDEGPLLWQQSTKMESGDTVSSLYSRFLFPAGVRAIVELAALMRTDADAAARPGYTQCDRWGDGAQDAGPEVPASIPNRASYEPKIDDELARVDPTMPASKLAAQIRGADASPGAWLLDAAGNRYGVLGVQPDTLSAGALSPPPDAVAVALHPDFAALKASVEPSGEQRLWLRGADQVFFAVSQLRVGRKRMAPAVALGVAKPPSSESNDSSAASSALTEQEMGVLRAAWSRQLGGGGDANTDDSIDFFECGGQSTDAVGLASALAAELKVAVTAEDVYACSQRAHLAALLAQRLRPAPRKDAEQDAIELDLGEYGQERLRVPSRLFIGGQFVPADQGTRTETVNPATEQALGRVSCAGVTDVDKAVRAAHNCFHSDAWKRASGRRRGQWLRALADALERRADQFAAVESLDAGAPISLAKTTHVGHSVATLRYFAGWADKLEASSVPMGGAMASRQLAVTVRKPRGVVCTITPWNFPLMNLCWKISAAIAAGCTVVAKPSEMTPLSALLLAKVARDEAQWPAGLFNVVPGGPAAGEALVRHPLVSKVSFTGSTQVGKQVMSACSGLGASSGGGPIKPCSLELGGKNALIVCADAGPLEQAVTTVVGAVCFNKGENCIAAGRVFVAESIAEEFVRLAAAKMGALRMGPPLDPRTEHGPANHQAHLDRLLEFVARAQADGARLVCGGRRRANQPGLFFEPAILVDVRDGSYGAREEAFGPIMCVSTFADHDVADAVRRANETEYGLAGGVLTQSLATAMFVAHNLDAGTIFVNNYNSTDPAVPFGGCNQSGFGKDLGRQALDNYLFEKSIVFQY